MKTGYSHYRRQHPMMRQERSTQFMGWLIVAAIIAAVAACEASKPLPTNLEKLALSDSALVRLHQAAQEENSEGR